MNQVKGVVQGIAKESPQAKVPDHLVKNDLVCILRARDILTDHIHLASEKDASGIFQRIKRKLGYRIDDNHRWRICPPPNKFVRIFRKFLAR